MLSPVAVQNQNRRFSVMGIRKIINSLPLRRKLLRNFLLRVRSNKKFRLKPEPSRARLDSITKYNTVQYHVFLCDSLLAPIYFYRRNYFRQYSKRDPITVCSSYNEQFSLHFYSFG
jgi:hypothetical protein